MASVLGNDNDDRCVLLRITELVNVGGISLNYAKIIDFELLRDGVKIFKETGKPLTIVLNTDDHTFGVGAKSRVLSKTFS